MCNTAKAANAIQTLQQLTGTFWNCNDQVTSGQAGLEMTELGRQPGQLRPCGRGLGAWVPGSLNRIVTEHKEEVQAAQPEASTRDR